MASEVLQAGCSVRIRVLGRSMLPTVWPGDVVTVEPLCGGKLRPGAIVLFARRGNVVVHRLKGIAAHQNQVSWISRGDAMAEDDPAWSRNEILGRVTRIERNGRVSIPKLHISILRRLAGWILCHSSFARNLCLRAHFRLTMRFQAQQARQISNRECHQRAYRHVPGPWNWSSQPQV